MRGRILICAAALTVLVQSPPGARLLAGEEPSRKEEGGVFGPTRVWKVHLELTAKEYEAVQPPPGGFGFPAPPPPRPEEKKDEKKRDSEKNLFGTDFPWAEGDVTVDGKTLRKVAVRYAGDITY